MAVPGSGSAFSISTPSATIALPPNRSAEVPFTVTNLTGRTLRAKATGRGVAPAADEWFTVAGDDEQQYEDGAIKQVRVVVDPALGAPAGRYAFRLDVAGVENPAADFAEGPECAVDVPASTTGLTTPRGYLMTLAGAAAGGVIFLGLAFWISTIEPSPSTNDCTGFGECLGQGIAEAIVFGLVLAVLGFLSLIAMWIVAAIGIGVALRLRHYRGGKLTATFFAVLMVPWTVLILVALELLSLSNVVIFFLAPVLLLIVPALLARALVLLIRTHRI